MPPAPIEGGPPVGRAAAIRRRVRRRRPIRYRIRSHRFAGRPRPGVPPKPSVAAEAGHFAAFGCRSIEGGPPVPPIRSRRSSACAARPSSRRGPPMAAAGTAAHPIEADSGPPAGKVLLVGWPRVSTDQIAGPTRRMPRPTGERRHADARRVRAAARGACRERVGEEQAADRRDRDDHQRHDQPVEVRGAVVDHDQLDDRAEADRDRADHPRQRRSRPPRSSRADRSPAIATASPPRTVRAERRRARPPGPGRRSRRPGPRRRAPAGTCNTGGRCRRRS